MKCLFIIPLALLLISCREYDKTLDVVLDAAKKGDLILHMEELKHIRYDYQDCFAYPPGNKKGSISDNIEIPQYFDSYEYVRSQQLNTIDIFKTVDLNIFGEEGADIRLKMESFYMTMDSAKVDGSTIEYFAYKAQKILVEFVVKNGIDRYNLKMFCLDSQEGFKIYLAGYEKITL